MSNYLQIYCPNCGAPISNANPTDSHYKCPYCGAEFFNPNIKEQTQEAYVFPIGIEDETFRQNVKDILANEEDIPLDFIDPRILSPAEITLYYVPFYVFKGIMHSSWSCDFVTKVERERTRYDGKRETYYENRYTPGSGSPSDNYEYLCVGTANQDERLGRFLRRYEQGLLKSLGKAKTSIQGGLQGEVLQAADVQDLWKEEVESHINSLGDGMCYHQASQHNGEISGFSSTTSIERKEERLYYLPVYILEVDYSGRKYYVMQDASNAYMDVNLPIDSEYIDKKNSITETKNKNLKNDPGTVLGPVAFLFGYGIFALFDASLLWKVIGGIALWIIYVLIEESRYRQSHVTPALAFLVVFAIFQLIDVGDGFWAFVCHFFIPLIASEIPALIFTSKENEINEANNKSVTDEYNKTMKALTDERSEMRRNRIGNL